MHKQLQVKNTHDVYPNPTIQQCCHVDVRNFKPTNTSGTIHMRELVLRIQYFRWCRHSFWMASEVCAEMVGRMLLPRIQFVKYTILRLNDAPAACGRPRVKLIIRSQFQQFSTFQYIRQEGNKELVDVEIEFSID